MQLSQLLVAYRGWGVDHQVDGFCGFGEGDDFAEAAGSSENHDYAVEAERDASVGRRSILECVKEESEARPGFFVGHA